VSDGFYRAFEERCYAPREVIKTLRKQYLPFVTPLVETYLGVPTFDIGCGRGEWLELMNEMGFQPYGVDLDEGMLDGCWELGLAAEKGDAVAFLSSLGSESQAVISAFHVVEHITFEQLRTVVSEAFRVLKPGGLLIMETPNPENIVVATRNFYLDPTHQRPIPSGLLSFLPEYYGFARTKVLRLQESKELAQRTDLTLQDVFGGASPDYAVVAQKAGPENMISSLDTPFSLEYGLSLENLTGRYQDQISARFQQAETKAQQAETKAQQAETKAQQAEVKTQQAEALLHAMRSSTFWRLTGPLRWLVGGMKSIVKRGLRRGYRTLAGSPRLLNILKRCLSIFPKLEKVVRRGVLADLVEPKSHDEKFLTDLELKSLMDIKDAIAASRESV